MNDDRVTKINNKSAEILQDLLKKIDEDGMTGDDLLATVYGSMVTAAVLGYSIDALVNDAKAAADRLMALPDGDEVPDDDVSTGENVKQNDQYPSYQELVNSFCDVLDGVQNHEIQEMTGLPDEDVERIIRVRNAVTPIWEV
jgi:hypothetical protein